MLSNPFIRFLVHPFFIGALITAGIFLFVPPVFKEYRIKTVENQYIMGNDFSYFEDLDADHISEKIQFDINDEAVIKIILHKGLQIVSQNNLNGKPLAEKFFYFGDVDHNDIRELFVLTIRDDSIFLNILDLFSGNPHRLKDRLIDFHRPAGNKKDLPSVCPAGLIDYDGDGFGEFVFSLSAGFSKQPRNVYLYNAGRDTLLKSPESGVSIHYPLFFDLDRDSVPEIVFGTLAPGNTDSSFPYSDQFAWLMALDQNLGFVFPPVQFSKYPSRLSVVPLVTANGNRLAVLHDYFGHDSIASTLGIYDEKGRLLKQKKLTTYEQFGINILPCPENRSMFYLVRDRESNIELLDTALLGRKTIRGPGLYDAMPEASLDADGDGAPEYVFMGSESGLFYIVRNDFSSFVGYHQKGNPFPRNLYSSVMLQGDKKPLLHLPFLHNSTILAYERNPLHKVRSILLFLAYFAVSGFLSLIYLLQRYRARLQYENTRKMNELQMRSIRNQIDPHFTFNILNAIGSLYASSKNREKADYLFGKYARLLRQTVLTSDQAEVTLEQELEFVKNYLDLERFRLNNKFDYSVEAGDGVNMSLIIPRLLIHTFAENAVKYAFMPKEGTGRLVIAITCEGGSHCITITDNGPGLHSARKNETAGTGKGLEIVNEMIALYHSLKKVKIQCDLDELSEDGTCTGTRARIIIMHA